MAARHEFHMERLGLCRPVVSDGQRSHPIPGIGLIAEKDPRPKKGQACMQTHEQPFPLPTKPERLDLSQKRRQGRVRVGMELGPAMEWFLDPSIC